MNVFSSKSKKTSIYKAKKVVLACGRWISEFVQDLKDTTIVVRQTVGYYQMKNMENYKVGKYPSWLYYVKD